MAALTRAEMYTQAGREPRSNPKHHGSHEGQDLPVLHNTFVLVLKGE